MMKRFSILLLALCLLVLPAAAMALEVRIGEELLPDGKYMASGGIVVVDTQPSGGYAHLKDGVLTLKDYSISGRFPYVLGFFGGDLEIRLEGENRLETTWEAGDGIANMDGKGLTIDGSGSLTVRADYGFYDYGYTQAGGWWARQGSLTIRGGKVTFDSRANAVTTGDVTITGGTTKITSQEDMGLYADGAISISGADTVVDITAPAEEGLFLAATVAYEKIKIASPLQIITPENGSVQSDGYSYYIVDADGEITQRVYIAAVTPAAASLPQTGDDSALMLWAMLACAAAAGALLMRRRAVN